MKCIKCHHDNPSEALFCMKCGARLERKCPKCGAEYPAEAVFCMKCGSKVAEAAEEAPKPLNLEEQFTAFEQALPTAFREQLLSGVEGENRLLTILFADMSDSVATTAQMQPEDAANLVNSVLKAMVDALLKYEGRIGRFVGDGVVAFFGAPQAHENDPERAILSALEIREAVQKLGLNVTVGVNTGEVYVGAVGSEQHREFTAMDPAVNLAARLEQSAEPGQILVGEATHRHTRRMFEFSPLSLQVKGFAQPVAAYEVLRVLPRPEKVRGIEGLRAELIGRDEEFAKLKDALEEVRRGRGQIVSLIGEAGVGKSRLVSELKVTEGRKQKAEGSQGESEGSTAYCLLPTG